MYRRIEIECLSERRARASRSVPWRYAIVIAAIAERRSDRYRLKTTPHDVSSPRGPNFLSRIANVGTAAAEFVIGPASMPPTGVPRDMAPGQCRQLLTLFDECWLLALRSRPRMTTYKPLQNNPRTSPRMRSIPRCPRLAHLGAAPVAMYLAPHPDEAKKS